MQYFVRKILTYIFVNRLSKCKTFLFLLINFIIRIPEYCSSRFYLTQQLVESTQPRISPRVAVLGSNTRSKPSKFLTYDIFCHKRIILDSTIIFTIFHKFLAQSSNSSGSSLTSIFSDSISWESSTSNGSSLTSNFSDSIS